MSRRCIVLCEDQVHEMFARRFLTKKGWNVQDVDRSPPGEGSAEQYVREEYPKHLKAVRGKNIALVVMIDGDSVNADKRMRDFDDACKEQGVAVRQKTDAVAVFVPEREIDNWICYLEGITGASKAEIKKRTKPAAKRLVAICSRGNSPADDFPDSLKRACEEWRRFL